MQQEEIRLNSYYATNSISEYTETEADKSVPLINKRIMRTSEFLQKIQSEVELNKKEYKVNHLFPPNCRYYEETSNGFFVVIEEPPAYRTITVSKDMSGELESLKASGKLIEYGYENWKKENPKSPYKFHLAMPYVVFFLHFSRGFEHRSGSVFFRTKPISGFADMLFKAPLLNISHGQSVCFGDEIYNGPRRSIFSDVNFAISSFWSTVFNPDYIDNYLAYQGVSGVCDYLTWQYYSAIDPLFIYSVDWIPAKYDVGQVIERLQQQIYKSKEHRNISYGKLTQLFRKPEDKGLQKVPGIGTKEPLLYDICQMISIDNHFIHVGDSFKNNNGKYYYIDSFLGFRKSTSISYINIQTQDGKMFRMRLTSKTKSYILKKILEERYIASATLKNGITIKSGDILIMKNIYDQNTYKKIYYIRRNVNGILEGRFGSDFYILENLPTNCSIVKPDEIKIQGRKLIEGKEYLIPERGQRGSIKVASKCKFTSITTNTISKLVLEFEEIGGPHHGEIKQVLVNDPKPIYDIDEGKPLPEIFRIGKQIYQTPKSIKEEPFKVTSMPGVGVIFPKTIYPTVAAYESYKHKLINEDKFFLAGWDLDLEFRIGEKVVVSNWENPLENLVVKQIEGFVEDSSEKQIKFILKDKNGNISEHAYVNTLHNIVQVGTVRKITNKWNDLSAGMKIKAKEPGISMFPKKDTNIIIGFLYDTGGPEPLVLCSNSCTLWYSDVIAKFDIISMDDELWKTLKHAPINPSRIRIQSGDFINTKTFSDSMGYVVYKPTNNRTPRALKLRYFSDYEDYYTLDGYFLETALLDGFPNPRLTLSQEEKMGYVSAFPNFHGMYNKVDESFSNLNFPNDKRSIIDVSSDSE